MMHVNENEYESLEDTDQFGSGDACSICGERIDNNRAVKCDACFFDDDLPDHLIPTICYNCIEPGYPWSHGWFINYTSGQFLCPEHANKVDIDSGKWASKFHESSEYEDLEDIDEFKDWDHDYCIGCGDDLDIDYSDYDMCTSCDEIWCDNCINARLKQFEFGPSEDGPEWEEMKRCPSCRPYREHIIESEYENLEDVDEFYDDEVDEAYGWTPPVYQLLFNSEVIVHFGDHLNLWDNLRSRWPDWEAWFESITTPGEAEGFPIMSLPEFIKYLETETDILSESEYEDLEDTDEFQEQPDFDVWECDFCATTDNDSSIDICDKCGCQFCMSCGQSDMNTSLCKLCLNDTVSESEYEDLEDVDRFSTGNTCEVCGRDDEGIVPFYDCVSCVDKGWGVLKSVLCQPCAEHQAVSAGHRGWEQTPEGWVCPLCTLGMRNNLNESEYEDLEDTDEFESGTPFYDPIFNEMEYRYLGPWKGKQLTFRGETYIKQGCGIYNGEVYHDQRIALTSDPVPWPELEWNDQSRWTWGELFEELTNIYSTDNGDPPPGVPIYGDIVRES